MQKIEIKNFGAIKEANIEIGKVLVLIGEQASGKSTLAKLIYFFKTLKNNLLKEIYSLKIDVNKKFEDEIKNIILKLFENFYNSYSNYQIIFYYSCENNKFLKMSNNGNKTELEFNKEKFVDFIEKVELNKRRLEEVKQKNSNYINSSQRALLEEKEKFYFEEINKNLCNLFDDFSYDDYLFIPDGRNITVSFSDFFQNHFYSALRPFEKLGKAVKEAAEQYKNSSRIPYNNEILEEFLMREFLDDTSRKKDFIKQKGGSFQKILESLTELKYKNIIEKINNILKGSYEINENAEKITINKQTAESINLTSASSGQKESIRIIQDIVVSIYKKEKIFRIIEEPEAHLFPVAQKYLMELLILMVNNNKENQLIITTHSPYILNIINNLLFANRVIVKSANSKLEVNKIIDQSFHIDSSSFSAYSLGNADLSENYCENIFNKETSMISQNYLDLVSEMLGNEFNQLFTIYKKESK